MDKGNQRIAILARQQSPLFHTKELAILWSIYDTNTLYTTLRRYTEKKLLIRIYRGLYSLLPIHKIDPYLLGTKALHTYAYISTETVLTGEGIITQIIHDITLISAKSKKFRIADHSYVSRKLSDKYLFNPVGISEIYGVLTASTERAVADLLYFNSRAVLDGKKMIDFKIVEKIRKEIGYPLTPNYYQ